MYVRIQGCLFRTYVCARSYKNVEKHTSEKSLLLSVDLLGLSDMPVYNQVRLRHMYVVFNATSDWLGIEKSPKVGGKRRVLSLWHLVVKWKKCVHSLYTAFGNAISYMLEVLWQKSGIILKLLFSLSLLFHLSEY